MYEARQIVEEAESIAESISGYSYMRNNHAYLEEDCDADLFFRKLKDNGEDYANIFDHLVNHYSENSRIRFYQHYNYDLYIKGAM